MTTRGWYNSDKFRAEDGYWLDLAISSSGSSALRIVGQTVGEVFKVEGSVYEDSVRISTSDVYQVQVENKAGHYEEIYIWTLDENHIIGNFKLRRTPIHYHQLLSVDAIMLAVGLVMILAVIYMGYRARQKAKPEYGCSCISARDMKATLKFAKNLDPDWCRFNIFIASPVSSLYEEILQKGLYDRVEDFLVYVKTQDFDYDSLLKIQRRFHMSFNRSPKRILRKIRREGTRAFGVLRNSLRLSRTHSEK